MNHDFDVSNYYCYYFADNADHYFHLTIFNNNNTNKII